MPLLFTTRQPAGIIYAPAHLVLHRLQYIFSFSLPVEFQVISLIPVHRLKTFSCRKNYSVLPPADKHQPVHKQPPSEQPDLLFTERL
jgi:hypothetical protein